MKIQPLTTRCSVRFFAANLAASPLVLCGVPVAAVVLGVAAAPLTAFAQSSSAAGVALPKGASPVSDAALRKGMGRMMAEGANLFHLPPKNGSDDNAEVYFWTGGDYKSGRIRFMETMLQSALNEAGYTVTNVDSHVDNVPNMFDTEAYSIGALDIQIFGDEKFFFYATNPTQRKSLVGFWLDQGKAKRVVLALAPAGFEGGPTPAHVPDVTDPDSWLIKNFKNAGEGMSAPPLPPFPNHAPKPGTVRGVVKDSGGKPIANAHLIAQSSAAGGFRTSHEARTNAQGIYEIVLPVGVCQIVNADCSLTFANQNLRLPLYPADGVRDEFLSTKGHVENFVLRTSGAADGDMGGNYGAPLRILTQNTPANSIVEVKLKPNGPLADGSRGKTLLIRFKGPKPGLGSSETILGGIPLGAYTLTARVFDGEDALPLRARKTFRDTASDDDPQLVTALPVVFEGQNAGGIANLGHTGIRRFEVTLEP